MPEDLAGDKAGDNTDQHRQEYQEQHHARRHARCGNMRRDERDHEEKHQRADKIVQRRHGDKRFCHRAGGVHLVDNGQRRCRRGRQRDTAEQECQINRHIGEMEDHAEHQADDDERTNRFRNRGDDDLLTGLFHLRPDQLCADHQADGAFQDAFCDCIPAGLHDGVAQHVDGVRPEDHACNQPAQNGWELEFGDQLAAHECNRNGKQQPDNIQQQHSKDLFHSKL